MEEAHNSLVILILVLVVGYDTAPVEVLSDSTISKSILQGSVESNYQVQNLNCSETRVAESEYVLLNNGSLLLPQNHHIYDPNSYFIQNGTAFICATVDEAEELRNESEVTNYNLSDEFIDCGGHILIEPHEFELLKNGTVYVSVYPLSYDKGNYFFEEKGVYICIPNFEGMVANSSDPSVFRTVKFSAEFHDVSVAGLSISITSLMLHLIVFCCVPAVRNLPGFCLASLSFSLLLAYICFISSTAVSNNEQCATLGLILYYLFLTSFFWMNAIAFDIWRSFRGVIRTLRISSHGIPWRRFLLYSAFSWLIPALLVIAAKVADTTDILPEDYRPSFGSRLCWFSQRKALLVFFATPVCLVMALNAIFFLDSAYVINRATLKKAAQREKTILRRRFFMFMKLALLMGLTWIIGIIASYANQMFLWYIFVVLNTLQGLFIFIVFSCSSKVRIFFLLKINGGVLRRQSTSVRTMSQTVGAI